LARDGIGAVLTELGEQVTSAADAAAVRDRYLDVLDRIGQARLPLPLPAHVSVKLTHLGLEVDQDACLHHLMALAARAAERRAFLWIDMEESRYVDVTLELFRRVRAARDAVGVCLQAYLRRTPADLQTLLPLGPAIRLVKGAYSEPPHVAFPRKRDVDAAYLALAEQLLLQAVRSRARPVFGTHDVGLLARIRARARELGAPEDTYEVHMLYGIRTADQRTLARAGVRVRVLISYGSHWFPWYMRRLAERPANVWFLLRNLL
jgi:proline dehydrogenase